MNTKLKKIWNTVSTIIVVLVAVAAVTLVGLKFFGMQVYYVVSGSMEPNIHVGALVVVKDTDFDKLEVGDAVTFVLSDGTPCTHRIISIDSENKYITTKGDANDSEDAAVYYKNIVGKVVANVPLLGYAVFVLQNPPGSYIAIAVVALIIALMFLPDIFKSEDNKNKQDDDSEVDTKD